MLLHDKLARALEISNGTYTLDDIVCEIRAGNMQSFTDEDGTWVVTRIVEFPRKTALEIVFYVGFIGGLDRLVARVLDFAHSEGATELRAFGRPGWNKFKARYGWRKLADLYVKDI